MTLNAWVLIDDACRINEYKTLGRVSRTTDFLQETVRRHPWNLILGIQNDTCDRSTLGESEGYAQEWVKSILTI